MIKGLENLKKREGANNGGYFRGSTEILGKSRD